MIAIIGLLASVVLLALNSARQKSRDAKRVADARQVASALELYYNDNNGYPAATGTSGLGAIVPAYMGAFPIWPTPSGTCTAANQYVYTSTGANASTYSFAFCLEGTTAGLGPGPRTVNEKGMQ